MDFHYTGLEIFSYSDSPRENKSKHAASLLYSRRTLTSDGILIRLATIISNFCR